jgi:hypothetical protein
MDFEVHWRRFFCFDQISRPTFAPPAYAIRLIAARLSDFASSGFHRNEA